MSIPLEAHHKAQSSEIFLSFQAKKIKRAVIFCTFERSYPSALRPILLKLHILTRLIESFSMVYELWRCIEVKLSIPLGAHA